MGSTGLTETQLRYSVYELELLGLVWSVNREDYFLGGIYFEVLTDHKSLTNVTSVDLDRITNNRIIRMLEHVLSYTFKVIHLPAAKNVFADWLSRYPGG